MNDEKGAKGKTAKEEVRSVCKAALFIVVLAIFRVAFYGQSVVMEKEKNCKWFAMTNIFLNCPQAIVFRIDYEKIEHRSKRLEREYVIVNSLF